MTVTKELTPIQYHTALYEELIENIDNALEAGIIDELTAIAHKAKALSDLQERLVDEEGITDEDLQVVMEADPDYEEEDEANYSMSNDNTANFSVGTRFGAALLELGEMVGYEDLESLVNDVAEVTQNSADDIVDLITGEAVPTDELAQYLSQCFELNDDYTTDLRLAAMEARGETLEDEESEEESEDAEYSQVQALQGRIAEFEQNQQIRDALSELELRAREAMPPVAVKVLLGDFSLESDRIAAFSQTAQLNNVTPDVELYALQKIVELFEKTGLNNTAMFQSFSNPSLEQPTDADKEIEAQAKRNFELRQARNHNLA